MQNLSLVVNISWLIAEIFRSLSSEERKLMFSFFHFREHYHSVTWASPTGILQTTNCNYRHSINFLSIVSKWEREKNRKKRKKKIKLHIIQMQLPIWMQIYFLAVAFQPFASSCIASLSERQKWAVELRHWQQCVNYGSQGLVNKQ